MLLYGLIVIYLFNHSAECAVHTDVQIFSKDWITNGSDFFVLPGKVFDEYKNSFSFVSCEAKQSKTKTKSCKVTTESWSTTNVSSVDTCDLSVETSSVINYYGFMRYYRLSLDRGLIAWNVDRFKSELLDEVAQLKLKIINLKSCTIVSELSFPLILADELNSKPILYRETFEIIFRDKNNCQGMPGCRIRYDFDGKQIGEPALYELKTPWNVLTLPVNDQSPDEGHHTFGFNFTNYEGDKYSTLFWTVVYVNPSGQELQQMIMPTKHYPSYRTAHSNSYKRYGLCRIDGVNDTMNEVYCTQFDNNKITLNLTLHLPELAHWIAVRNLDGGGMLLVTGKCKRDPYNFRIKDNECKGFRMQRIASDGRTFKAIEIDNFESEGTRFGFEDELKITENNDQFCFFWIVTELTYKPHRTKDNCYDLHSPFLNGCKSPWNDRAVRLKYQRTCVPKKNTLMQL